MIENRRRPSAEAAGVDHSGPQFRRLELERATFFEPELSPILCAPVKILIIFKPQLSRVFKKGSYSGYVGHYIVKQIVSISYYTEPIRCDFRRLTTPNLK